jgi:hypothetical protein
VNGQGIGREEEKGKREAPRSLDHSFSLIFFFYWPDPNIMHRLARKKKRTEKLNACPQKEKAARRSISCVRAFFFLVDRILCVKV